MGDGLGRMEEVTEGFNNMCTVIGDIISSVTRVVGYGGVRCCGKKSRDDVSLGQHRVVLGYRGDLCGRICSHTTAHE